MIIEYFSLQEKEKAQSFFSLGRESMLEKTLSDVEIQRTHALHTLDEVRAKRGVFLSAPPGSGKTTLLRQWLRSIEKENVRVYAIPLTADHNQKEQFWKTMLKNLTQDYDEEGAIFRPSSFLKRVWAANNPITFILDDFHHVLAHDLLVEIASTVLGLPQNVQFIMAGRHRPPYVFQCLQGKEQFMYLEREDLLLSKEEIGIYLEKHNLSSLTKGEMEQLYGYTEGWATGLYHVIEILQTQGGPRHLSKVFKEAQKRLNLYFQKEVMKDLTSEMQDFLCKTADLPRLEVSLCNAVGNWASSRDILKELHSRNAFVFSMNNGATYCYHPQFAAFLEQINKDRSSIPQDPPQSFRKDHNAERGWNPLIRTRVPGEEWAMHFSWLADIFSEIASFCTPFSANSIWEEGPHEDLRQLEKRVDLMEERVYHEFLLLKAFLKTRRGDLEEAGALSRQALAGLSRSFPEFTGGHYLNLGCVYLGQNSLEKALDALAGARAVAEKKTTTPQTWIYYYALGQQALMFLLQGKWHQGEKMFMEIMGFLEQTGNDTHPLFVFCSWSLAFMQRERGELELAQKILDKAMEYTLEHGRIEEKIIYCLSLAFLAYCKRDLEEAFSFLEEGETLALKYNDSRFQWMIDVYKGLLQAARGNDYLASTILANLKGKQGSRILYQRLYEKVLVLHTCNLLNRHGEVLENCQDIIDLTRKNGWSHLLLFAQVEKVVASWALHRKKAALATLKDALQIAESEGMNQLFFNHGSLIMEPMALLLKEGVLESEDVLADHLQEYCHHLYSHLEQEYSLERHGQGGFHNLTYREAQVLQLIGDGKSNQEIAGILIISLGTVKRHVSNILKKLHVKNRAQALALMQKNNLLDDTV